MKNLKTIRLKKGFKCEEMAEKLGIKVITYHSYEQGLREPKHNRLKQISEILECTLEELI